jgi:ABC-2 type transport system permease protein
MWRAFTDFGIGILKSLTRVSSFISKEVVEVVRRPGTLLSLVLGPFLIMALFGFGYGGQRRPLDTVIVLPANSPLSHDPPAYQEYGGLAVRIVQVTEDLEAARERLRREEIDLLVVVPGDVEQRFMQGQQSEIGVEYNQIDPVRDNYARFVAYRQVQELNKAIIQMVAERGEQYVVQQTGSTEIRKIPPEVLAAPLMAETHNWAPTNPDVVRFYAPAVLALVLQHMAITLTALSMVRERLSGAFDLFRVAPLRSVEILVGKYLAYGFLNLAIGAIVSFLLVGVLRVPLLGQPIWFAAIVMLLTFASLGLGLLISVLANSERQAVQLAMLVLLASVFFSGFVLPLDEFFPQVRYLAYALPVTHGIRLLQDFMLRGGTYAVWQVWALALVGVVLFLITGLSLRRSMARA